VWASGSLPQAAASASADTLCDLSAGEALAAMRGGAISAEAYATALLDRAAATQQLNAFISLDRATVLEAAHRADRRRRMGEPLGRLHGLPVPIKDSIITRDWPTSLGSAAMRHFTASQDAPVVTRLLRAGAIVMGKTNLHEMSYGLTSNNAVMGAVHNPYRPSHIAGGSSGGSAAVVAARVAPVSLAADTGGSIRVPASLCGICGLRPSFRRYPTEGLMPIAPDYFDGVGPMARTVRDLALFDGVLVDAPTPVSPVLLQGIRLGIAEDYFEAGIDPAIEKVMAQAFDRLRAAGVALIEAPLPPEAWHANDYASALASRQTVPKLKAFLRRYHPTLPFDSLLEQMSPDMNELFKSFALPGGADYCSDEDYQTARTQIRVFRSAMARYFHEFRIDAVAFPTTIIPAQPIGQDDVVEVSGAKIDLFTALARNVAIGTCGGLPGLVLPAGMTADGLPAGMEFDGPHGADRRLLGVGLRVEEVLGALPAPS
jgi:mandelamide amidase